MYIDNQKYVNQDTSDNIVAVLTAKEFHLTSEQMMTRDTSSQEPVGFLNRSVRIVNPLEIDNWNKLVLEHNEYSIFHTREWAHLLVSSYGYRPVYFTIFSNDKLLSLVPAMQIKSSLTGNRLVCLPFSDVCEPFLGSHEDFGELSEKIFEYCTSHKLNSMEYRVSDTIFPLKANYFRIDLRHVLILKKDETELFKSFSVNTKRNIQKALKNNVEISLRNDKEGLKIFYNMLCDTRKRHGLPPQPYKFYLNLFNHIIYPGSGDILLASHNDKFIAGAIYLKFGKKILFKFGASFSKYHNLGANHLVMWESIRRYINEGYEEFDFGRTELNHKGLRRFKLGWNTEELQIYTIRYDLEKKQFLFPPTNTNGIHNSIFNHSPIFMLKLIGNYLYRHIG